MKHIFLVCAVVLIVLSCDNNNQKKPQKTLAVDSTKVIQPATSFKPYSSIDNFIVTDTGHCDFGEGDGSYAVVMRNGKLIDTIDKNFGIQKVDSGKYLYLVITGAKNNIKEGQVTAAESDYILLELDNKQKLISLTSNFDNYFSQPSIIDHKIYFWQINRPDNTSPAKVSAAMYDPVTSKTISYYIEDNPMDFDDPGYFGIPYEKSDTIFFEDGQRRMVKLSKDLKRFN
jgi:hypothetical protein